MTMLMAGERLHSLRGDEPRAAIAGGFHQPVGPAFEAEPVDHHELRPGRACVNPPATAGNYACPHSARPGGRHRHARRRPPGRDRRGSRSSPAPSPFRRPAPGRAYATEISASATVAIAMAIFSFVLIDRSFPLPRLRSKMRDQPQLRLVSREIIEIERARLAGTLPTPAPRTLRSVDGSAALVKT